MTEGRIPLVDLAAQHEEVAGEVAAGFARVMEATAFVQGPEVAAFEAELAAYCGVGHCVGVANGTEAIELALRALEVGTGDEVIVPANTFVATAEAVIRAGATPVLADVDPATHLLGASEASRAVTARTKAVVPVHLYGQLAPLEDLIAVAEAAGAVVVEDAAQAHGATRRGVAVGQMSAAAATSFYPGKNLGAYGDGGAVLTQSVHVARRVRALGNHGGLRRNEHGTVGFNSRLDTLQAVVLRAKLRRLDVWNDARRTAARRYDRLLAGIPGVRAPSTLHGNEHVFHLYVVRVAGGRRDHVLSRLNAAGIEAGVHYPVPVHLQGAFRFLGHKAGDFPVAERAAAEVLSLPMHPHITPAQQERVVEVLAAAL